MSDRPLDIIQTALRREGEIAGPATAQTGWTNPMYRPSPGQLVDHVHHRIAAIAVRALEAEGYRIVHPGAMEDDCMDRFTCCLHERPTDV